MYIVDGLALYCKVVLLNLNSFQHSKEKLAEATYLFHFEKTPPKIKSQCKNIKKHAAPKIKTT